MRSAKLFLLIGVWVAVLPYLGFPYVLKNVLFSATGLLLVYISLVLKAKEPKKKLKSEYQNFSESGPGMNQDDPTKEVVNNI